MSVVIVRLGVSTGARSVCRALLQGELADVNSPIVPLFAAHAATMDATAVAHTAARISDFGWI
jgi:hypothetical protein